MSWTTETLTSYFNRIGVPERKYSFYKDKDDAICIEKKGDEWRVFYSERGSKSDLGWGKSEGQALEILRLFVISSYK